MKTLYNNWSDMFRRYFVALPFTMKCAWHFVVFFLAQAPESSIDQRLCLRRLEAFGWHQGRSPTWERRPGPQAQSKAVAAPSEGDLLLHWQRRWRWWESGWTACWMRAWLKSGRSSVWKMTVFWDSDWTWQKIANRSNSCFEWALNGFQALGHQ